jgi:putative holliday junction resolvase
LAHFTRGGSELPKDFTNENPDRFGAGASGPAGRLLALDLGEKRVGVAVCDELQLTIRPLPFLRRTNWKQLLGAVADLLQRFDARALVIGLPLNLEGGEGEAAAGARRLARNFALSLHVPVFLQDERLTTREAEESLLAAGHSVESLRGQVDGEAAAIILRDFLARPRQES